MGCRCLNAHSHAHAIWHGAARDSGELALMNVNALPLPTLSVSSSGNPTLRKQTQKYEVPKMIDDQCHCMVLYYCEDRECVVASCCEEQVTIEDFVGRLRVTIEMCP